jgi:hypothetical protein
MGTGSFSRIKRPKPPPSNEEVKEIVELNIYFLLWDFMAC